MQHIDIYCIIYVVYIWYYTAIFLKLKNCDYFLLLFCDLVLSLKSWLKHKTAVSQLFLPLFHPSLSVLSASLPAPESWFHLRGSVVGLFLVLGGWLVLSSETKSSVIIAGQ